MTSPTSRRCARCGESPAETYWPTNAGEQTPVCAECDHDLAQAEQR